MCGFAGVLSLQPVSEEHARPMGAAVEHRGPDDQGVWCDSSAGIGLAFARLAILDLSAAGHQPMVSRHGRYVIAFNGEIYNYLDLRRELDSLPRVYGGSWHGHSDTEVLLAGFDAWGIERTLHKTVGMFAFGVWDRRTKTLTLGRDRLGEKPLYYGWQGDTFLFGSELKALRAHPAFRADIDRDALAAYMRYSYIPAPGSIYRGIHKLLPGTLLEVRRERRDGPAPRPYWSLLEAARKGIESPFAGSTADALEGLEARLSEAVALQQIADVPLGAFLSGGVDSSTVVALMQKQSSRPVHSFTIGFEATGYNEAQHAAAVARHLGTDHTELYVSAEETRAVIPRLPALYDEPFADSSQVPTFLVSQLARRSVTVSLSGDGGDELFGGYNRYTWARRSLLLPAPLRRTLARGIASLTPATWDRVYSVLQPLVPRPLRVRMPGDKAHKLAHVWGADSDAAVYQYLVSTWAGEHALIRNGRDTTDLPHLWEEVADLGAAENRMMAIDALTYLPDDILCKVDRAAMGISLETRVPLLDHRVVEYAWRLPLNMKIRNGQGKWILRQLLYKYVPEKLIERPKMGFGLPIGSWLRGPLRDWAEDLLAQSRLEQEGFLNAGPIREKWAEHLSGMRNWQYQLWTVLMFQAWLAERKSGTE
jgi:asparagine synthase (glutamine-hydrolysing)